MEVVASARLGCKPLSWLHYRPARPSRPPTMYSFSLHRHAKSSGCGMVGPLCPVVMPMPMPMPTPMPMPMPACVSSPMLHRHPTPHRTETFQAFSETTEAAPEPSQDTADPNVALLKAATSDKTVPGTQVLQAMLALEKAKMPMEDLADVLCGHNRKGGKRWQLIFHARKEQVSKAMRGEKAGGYFYPITAVQRWDSATGKIENGTYFGWIFALGFKGPFEVTGRKLSFTFDQIRLRLGPKWLSFPLKPGQLGTKNGEDDKKGPFFLFIMADDEIAVARGRGGGVALWKATSPSWEAESGVAL